MSIMDALEDNNIASEDTGFNVLGDRRISIVCIRGFSCIAFF